MSILDLSALEVERALISACIIDPAAFNECDLDAADFASPKWRDCWLKMGELSQAGEAWDLVVMLDRVAQLTAGDVELWALGAMAPMYAARVAENAQRRRVKFALSAALSGIDEDTSSREALDNAYRLLSEITTKDAAATKDVGSIVRRRYVGLGEIHAARERGETISAGIPTGIEKLDEILGGLQRGIATLAAARPRMGKSTLALTVTNAASKAGFGVHVFSLEEPEESYADRVICQESHVDTQTIRSVTFNQDQFQRIAAAGEKLVKRKGWLVDDRCGISAEDIVRSVRRERAQNKTELVVVDYITLLKRPKGMDTRGGIDHNITVLADAAKQDNMSYLVLAQLNRDCEKREDKRPQLSDLKESGTLEERAKAVLMLYRPHVYDTKADPSDLRIYVRKNSQGSEGTIMTRWEPEKMRVIDERL